MIKNLVEKTKPWYFYHGEYDLSQGREFIENLRRFLNGEISRVKFEEEQKSLGG